MPIWKGKNQNADASHLCCQFKVHKKTLCSLTQILFSPISNFNKNHLLICHKLHLVLVSYAPLMKNISSLNHMVHIMIIGNLKSQAN
jgi:diketogulonate reductase-like aldo/keto reductase